MIIHCNTLHKYYPLILFYVFFKVLTIMLSKFYFLTANVDSSLNLPHWFVRNKNSTDKNFVSKSRLLYFLFFLFFLLFCPFKSFSISFFFPNFSRTKKYFKWGIYAIAIYCIYGIYCNWRLLIPAGFKIALFEMIIGFLFYYLFYLF